MREIRVAGTLLLAGMLLAGCERQSGSEQAAEAVAPVAAPAAGLADTASADELRQLAGAAMQAQRLFAPARGNALEYYLALRRRAPTDASAQAALVDLQPQLVIAVEQAIATGRYPEAQRLLGLLQQVDAGAPALQRLRESVASAEAAARDLELAMDAESKARALQAEVELRRQAEDSAAKLASARNPATPAEPVAAATPAAPTPAQSRPLAVAPLAAAAAPAATVPGEAVARQPEPPRPAPASAPVRSAASAAPRVLRQAAPRYPEAALRSRQSGQVQVAFTIDGDGNVEAPRVVASDLPNAFERAALAAVSRWKFEARGTQHATTTTVRFDPPSS